jgi:hypothetical protein
MSEVFYLSLTSSPFLIIAYLARIKIPLRCRSNQKGPIDKYSIGKVKATSLMCLRDASERSLENYWRMLELLIELVKGCFVMLPLRGISPPATFGGIAVKRIYKDDLSHRNVFNPRSINGNCY